MQPEHVDATCDYEPWARAADREAPRPVAFAAASATPTAELQLLLRRRLLFAAVLFMGIDGVAFVVDVASMLQSGESDINFWGLKGHFLVAVLVAWRLWKSEGWSVARLRWYEAALFGSILLVKLHLAFNWETPRALTSHALELWQSGQMFLAETSFGAATAWNLMYWVLFILAYGVLIPNTWQRCTVIVGSVSLLVLLSFAGAGMWLKLPVEVWSHDFVLYPLTVLGFTAALAIYASHRIEQSRREAVAARQLGQYQLKYLLGKGGMGEVYLAEHLMLRRPCAVKLIRPERAEDVAILTRFEREVRLTASLTHPNTIQIFDYGHTEDGTFYYAMEYLPGQTLEELVQRGGPVSPGQAVHYLRQVCGALGEAHAVGLIHRDIKPSNVMVCERGGIPDVAKLLDFGLVRARPDRDGDTHLTRDGAIAGTPAFMSPEQASGSDHLDARSDIYALGVLAYFLLTGRPPFSGRSATQVLAAHIYESPAPLRTHRPDLTVKLEEVVLCCLAKVPADRFPDVAALDRALTESVDHAPTDRRREPEGAKPH